MINIIKENRILNSLYAQQLNMDDWNKTIIFERNNLIFIFNFHVNHSVFDYGFRVPQPGNYRIILNSDASQFGGHNRIDDHLIYSTFQNQGNNNHYLQLYVTNRTALVLKREEGD